MPIGFLWQTFLETPLINLLVGMSVLTFGSYGLAILLFTVITRAVTFPLTLRTLNSTRKMQEMQPQLEVLKKKYSDPKRRSEETMKLYRESGINPLGCVGGQLLQLPIFIALYQVIRITLGTTPESVVGLSHRLYDFSLVQGAVPLSTNFLFIDLGKQGNIPLLVFVVASSWLQQRISTGRNASTAKKSDQQQQMAQMMQWMMPLMFGWFVLVVPAGLALYWAASTTIGIILQWVFVGPGDFTWGSLIPPQVRAVLRPGLSVATAGADAGSAVARGDDHASDSGQLSLSSGSDDETTEASESRENDESSGNSGKNGRRSRRTRPRSARSRQRSGRRRGNQRR